MKDGKRLHDIVKYHLQFAKYTGFLQRGYLILQEQILSFNVSIISVHVEVRVD